MAGVQTAAAGILKGRVAQARSQAVHTPADTLIRKALAPSSLQILHIWRMSVLSALMARGTAQR